MQDTGQDTENCQQRPAERVASPSADADPSTLNEEKDVTTDHEHNRNRATEDENQLTARSPTWPAVERDHEPNRQRPAQDLTSVAWASPRCPSPEPDIPARAVEHDAHEHEHERSDCAGCGQRLLLTRPGRTLCARCEPLVLISTSDAA